MTASSHRLLLSRLEGAYHQFNESGSELARGKLIGLLLAAELTNHSSPKTRAATLLGAVRDLTRSQPAGAAKLTEIVEQLPGIAADLERRSALVIADKVQKEQRKMMK